MNTDRDIKVENTAKLNKLLEELYRIVEELEKQVKEKAKPLTRE